MPKVITVDEVGGLIKDGATIYTPGFTGAFAEEVVIGIEKSFLETDHPRDLTIYYPALGNFIDRGMGYLAHEGLLKRIVASHFRSSGPKIYKMAGENICEAYNIPLGVLNTMARNIAGRRPGIITKVGLGTFIDPRVEGGKLNQKAKESEDLVKVIELDNEEWLYYKLPKVDVTLIRGSVADENGNISTYREGYVLDWLSAALAAKASGGIVIAQVEHIVKAGSIHPKEVKVPGMVVDYILVAKPEYHWQTAATYFNPLFTGEIKVSLNSMKKLPLSEQKIIARRATMELSPGAIVNLGVGTPEVVSAVAAEEHVDHLIYLTTEAGGIGGVPAAGNDFGCAVNAEAIIETSYLFDFYDGGGLDVAYLGMAQVDRFGNVNVSKLGPDPIGVGGFINITQNAKKVVYCGTFTAGGLVLEVEDGKLKILQEGRSKKFISNVQQITFSGEYANSIGQQVLFVTERAVLQLTPEGLELIEIAPGVDLEKDILQQMEFKPIIRNIKPMAPEIFQETWGRLGTIMQVKRD